LLLPSRNISVLNSAPVEEKLRNGLSCVTILKDERAGESADLRADVLHPGELDGKYVQRLAKYVDDKMHDIADVTKTVDTQKVAVLAALAIADELHSMQRDRGDHEQLMREQAERCLTLVERALKQTA